MKNIVFKWIAGALLLSVTMSCSDMIEEYNPSGITSETVYNTPQGFETLINAAYSYQRWWTGKEEGYSLSEMGTDLWMSGAGDIYPDLTKYVNLQRSEERRVGKECIGRWLTDR